MANDLIKQVTPLYNADGYPLIKDINGDGYKEALKSTILRQIIDKLPDIGYIDPMAIQIPDDYILIKIGEKVPEVTGILINPNMQSVITGEIIKVGGAITKLKVGDTLLDYNPARGGMIVIKGVIYQSVREDNAVLWI